MIIARIGQIVTLNGSAVRPREREDAEKGYIRSSRAAFFSSKGLPDSSADAEVFGECKHDAVTQQDSKTARQQVSKTGSRFT